MSYCNGEASITQSRWCLLCLLSILCQLCCGCRQHESQTDASSEVGVLSNDIEKVPAAIRSRQGEVTWSESHESNATDSAAELSTTRMFFSPLSQDQFPRVVPGNGEQHGFATILESLGSGAAAVDFDRDGRLDCLIVGGGDLEQRQLLPGPVFAIRRYESGFAETTRLAGLDATHYYNHGIAVTDADNDGFQDLLITGYGGIQYFMNQGDGTFITRNDVSVVSDLWCSSAAWADFNKDGNPDVYVATYVDWSFENDPPCYASDGVTRDNCSPKIFNSQPDRLLMNKGDGRFGDESTDWGLRKDNKALGVVAADMDLDGWVDIYVGNDVMINFLYRNQEGLQFEDRTISSGAGVSSRGTPDASMGVDVADFNGDGLPDIWAANFELESFAVYRNQGNLLFRNVSDFTGVSAMGGKFVGWGSAFADLDIDGDLDIVVCNGNVVKHPQHSPVKQRMLLLENKNCEYFDEVASVAGESLVLPRDGRGLAVGDWNDDGLMDLLISPTNAPAELLLNRAQVDGHWLVVRLVGTKSARQPVGTQLELQLAGSVITRQLKGGGSYASSSSADIHFGIGADQVVEKLIIRWPTGEVSEVASPQLDQLVTIVEGQGVFSFSREIGIALEGSH